MSSGIEIGLARALFRATPGSILPTGLRSRCLVGVTISRGPRRTPESGALGRSGDAAWGLGFPARRRLHGRFAEFVQKLENGLTAGHGPVVGGKPPPSGCERRPAPHAIQYS